MTGYYDLVLGAIPVSLIGVSGALSVAGLALTVAVPLAAVVSVGLIGHAMFVNGPVDARVDPPDRATDGDSFETGGTDADASDSGPAQTAIAGRSVAAK
jgi:hypothetical protein